jgi:hypothetical protein
VPFEEFLLEYFGFVQKNFQPHYFEVSDSNNCGELLSESTTQHGALYFTWKIAWVLVGCSGGCSDQASSGESRVSEFGGLIHGDDTSYVHNRGMITGFHHEKLWDPGGTRRVMTVEFLLPYGPQGDALLLLITRHPITVHCAVWFSLFDILKAVWSSCQFMSYMWWSHTAVSIFFSVEIQTLKGPMEQWDPGIERGFHFCTQDCHVPCHLKSAAITTEPSYNQLLQPGLQLYTMDYALLHGHAHNQAARTVLERISSSQFNYMLQSCDAGHACLGVSASLSSEVLTIEDRKLIENVSDNMNLLSRVQDVQLLVKFLRSCEQGHTFHEAFLSFVSMVVLSDELQFSWDPGGVQSEAKGRRITIAPAYYRVLCLNSSYYFDQLSADQDYYIAVFLDQVHIGHDYYLDSAVCGLDVVPVCLDYDTHRNLGEVKKHHVPWDPGGSTWHRLGVKPQIKEGGMLATFVPSTWAGPRCAPIGLVLLGSHKQSDYINEEQGLRTAWLGFGRLRPPQLRASFFF